MKSIFIFLTRTESITSKIVKFFTSDKYTHSAIAFDKELFYLYSSGRKNGIKMFPAGPCMESLNRGFYERDPHTPCVVYELPVTDEAFALARKEVDAFMANIDDYKFSVLGIAACKLGIKWTRKNKYFCSQFVAQILRKSGAATLPKEDSLMRPLDYAKLEGVTKVFEGTIAELKAEINKKEAVTL